MSKLFKFERKFGWSEMIAVTAIILSAVAIWQSHLVQKNARIINKIDFRPILSLQTHLNKKDTIPPFISVKNNGSVDATQIRIKFYLLQYSPKEKKILSAETKANLEWIIDRLPATKQEKIIINEIPVNDMFLSMESEKYNIVLEIRLFYRREVDLKAYRETTFRFMNPEGKWVRENSDSLSPEIYNPIKKALLNRLKTINRVIIDLDSLDSLEE